MSFLYSKELNEIYLYARGEKVPPKMYCTSSVDKNISMNLHSKAGVGKNMVPTISIYTYLLTPALECNLSEIFLKTPALECIFGNTRVFQIFLRALPPHPYFANLSKTVFLIWIIL